MAAQSLRRLLHLSDASLSEGSLLLSLHPDGSRLAAARGPALFICPLLPVASPQFAAAEPSTAEGTEDTDELQEQQQQQAFRERQATHGSAGSRGGAGLAVPLRFTCPEASGPAAVSQDDITALAWLAFARPPSATQSGSSERGGDGISGGGGGGGGGGADWARGLAGRTPSDRRRTNSSSGSGGVFASIQVMLEDHELGLQKQAAVPGHPHPGYSLVVLLSGTRGGALQLHDADCGAVLMRQQLHPGPVVSIAVRTWRMGLNPSEAVEDVTVGWANAVVRLAAWELRAVATTCYAAAAAAAAAAARTQGGGGSGGQPRFGLWGSSAAAASSGPDIKPLAVQKWEVPAGVARGRSCVVCCGQRPRDLYSLLQGIGSTSTTATGKTIFLAGGNRPACLAALEVDEQSSGGGGALSYISSVATSVWGLARTARNVAAAPLSLRDGLKHFVMNPLQLVGGGGGSGSAAGAAAPLASFPDATAGQRLTPTGVWRQVRDDGRAVLALAPAPHGSLVAAVDGLGRLMLVEVGAMLVTRMWKGYRDAQVAWMEARVSSVAGLQERQRHRERQRHSQHEQQQQQQPGGQLPATSMQASAACEGTGGEASQVDTAARGAGRETQSGREYEHGWGLGREDDMGGVDGLYGAVLRPPLGAAAGAQPLPPQQLLLQQHAQQHSTQHALHCKVGDGASGDRGCGGSGERFVLLLVVYAPRRQSLELWFPLQGERLAAVVAPPKARLLQRGGGGSGGGGELGTWRVADAGSAASPPMTATGCMMCFAGSAPRLGLGTELELGGAGGSEGLELLDVGSVFGLA